MFGIGILELCIICLAALVLVGPQKLPHVMKEVGKFFVQMRRMSNEVKHSMNEVVREVDDEVQQVKDDVLEPVQSIKESALEPIKSVKALTNDPFLKKKKK